MRTTPNIDKEVKQLDDVVRTEFKPAITGGINCFDLERKLLSFPPRLGGYFDIFRNRQKRVRIFHHDIERSNNKDSKSTSSTSI